MQYRILITEFEILMEIEINTLLIKIDYKQRIEKLF